MISKRSMFRTITGLVLVTLGSAFHSSRSLAETAARGANPATVATQRGHFISIDGLRPDYLKTLSDEGKLTAHRGLGWLYRNSLRSHKASPVEITLTAPSHVGTITCSRPSSHGIIANNFMLNDQVISGFGADIGSETLWQAARSSGRSVLSLAYVGTDGRTPERTVDKGVAYPDNRFVGPSQTVSYVFAEQAEAQGWNLESVPSLAAAPEHREAVLTITTNPATRETRAYNVLLSRNAERRIIVTISDTKDLSTSSSITLERSIDEQEWKDLFWIENNAASAINGFKRRAYALVTERNEDKVTLFVSKTTYNNVHPVEFREFLDAQNLVWPDEGLKGDRTPTGPSRMLTTYNIHGRFLAEVGRVAKGKFNFDVVLFYQPMIDSLGHSYEAMLPKPFTSANSDFITQAYVQAFQLVDANVSMLLEDFRPSDVVALMGDHGMDPVKKVLNLAALIPESATRIRVVTSGSLALIYRATDSTNEAADVVGAELDAKFREARWEETPAYGKAFRLADVNTAAGEKWQYGDAVWAFTAGEGFFFRFDAVNLQQMWIDPPALGMHGQHPSVANMDTGLLLRVPRLKSKDIGPVNLIDVVPTFSKLLGFRAPQNCEGKPIKLPVR